MSTRYRWASGALLVVTLLAPLGASAQGASDTIFVDPESYREAEVPEAPGSAATPEGYGAPRPAASRLTVLGFGTPRLRLFLSATPSAPLHEFCTAPCVSELMPGTYRFGVAPQRGGPRMADDQPMRIGRDSVAILHYDNRGGLRSVGWAFFSAAATTLALSTLGGVFGVLLVGVPLAAAFMIPFFAMAFLMDSARVEIATLPR